MKRKKQVTLESFLDEAKLTLLGKDFAGLAPLTTESEVWDVVVSVLNAAEILLREQPMDKATLNPPARAAAMLANMILVVACGAPHQGIAAERRVEVDFNRLCKRLQINETLVKLVQAYCQVREINQHFTNTSTLNFEYGQTDEAALRLATAIFNQVRVDLFEAARQQLYEALRQ